MDVELKQALETITAGLTRTHLVLVIGKCQVKYEGRAASKLSEGDRLLVIKHDGTFLVHQSTKMAAINYQGPGAKVTAELETDPNNTKSKEPIALVVQALRTLPNGAKERIMVKFYSILFAQAFPITDDTQLKLFGSEKELSHLLMQDLHLIEPCLRPLQQESDVPKGTIDILAEDAKGRLVIIEVKRRTAGLDAVTQLKRYVGDMAKRRDKQVRGILCSPHVTDSAKKMLDEAGLEYAKLDYEISNPSAKIRGLQKKQKELGEYAVE